MGIPAPPQLKSSPTDDPQGLMQEIASGLKAIPHLPGALIDGVDAPGITPEESQQRHQAMAIASQWVLPTIISGAVHALPLAAGPEGVLISAVADALGFGIGSAAGAHYEGNDENMLGAGLSGAAFGGILGAGGAALKWGGKLAEGAAAKVTEEKAAQATAAAEAAKNVMRADDTPLASFKPKAANGFAATEPSGLPAFVRAAAERGQGEASDQLAERATAGELTPPTPVTFDGKNPVPFSKPTVVANDAVALALNGIEGYPLQPTAARAVGVSDAFAPDQVLTGSFSEFGQSILRGQFQRAMESAQKMGQNITLSDAWRQAMEAGRRAIAPARVLLQKMGPAGAEMATHLDDVFEAWRGRAGKDMAELQDIFGGMDKAARIHIGEVVEGLATAQTDAEATAAQRFRVVMDRYANDAEQMGFHVHGTPEGTQDFTRRSNYMTHYFTEKAIKDFTKQGTPEYEAAHRLLTELGATRSRKETAAALTAWMRTPSEFRTGPLNNVRQHFNIPYEKDPLLVGSKYAYQVSKRLELAKVFGTKDQLAHTLVERIGLDGGNPKAAMRVYEAFSDALPQEYGALVRAAQTYNIWTMLSTSGLVQPAQLLNTAAKVGYVPTLKAIGAFLRDPKTSDYMATRAGVHINEVLQDWMGESFSENPNTFFLKNIIGLEPLDKINRIISAVAGRFQLDALAEKLANAKSVRGAGRIAEQLKGLDVDPAELIANNHVPTAAMYDKAAYRASIDTQHASGVLDQPEIKNTAIGKILLHFRSFAMQQGTFINRDILRPAKTYLTSGGARGSLAPLVRYSAGMGPTGYVIGNLVRGFKGKVAPSDPALAMLENVAYSGGFGIYYDMMDSMMNGKDRILSMLAGPSISEAAAYIGDIGAVAKGNPEQLAKHLVRRLPVVGQPLANYWFFPPK